MPTYARTTRVAAPFDEVWAFHATADGLEALTPEFMHLDVEQITGPEGDPDPEVLEPGSRIEASMQPFGVGPRQRWTSVIEEREEREGAAYFVDSMADGPFPEWEHTHAFFADGDETVVRDRVEYRLPLGGIGDALGPVSWVGFEPMFRYRHRETKRLLESGDDL
jgi:ligand-binding SRPBCC domain-containing protein